MGAIYGSDALRRLRDQQDARITASECQPSLLNQIPPDAPMDDATLTVWNGERFVAYNSWLATAPIQCDENPPKPVYPAAADCIVGECGSTRIRLVKDGERWLMFTGSPRACNRRRDFASPFLAHAVRTAEQWYGAPAEGWHPEKKANETSVGLGRFQELTA
jgi:hypothetical protein